MTTHSERAQPPGMTIEKLLQLKRAERPAPEFWSQFEQELRAKQLAAIVEKRPWWMALRLPALSPALRRFQLPVGAAAVLVVTFLIVSERGLPGPRSINTQPAEVASAGSVSDVSTLRVPLIAATATPPVASPEKSEPLVPRSVLAEVKLNVEVVASPSPLIAETRARVSEPAGLMEMIPWAASFRVEAKPSAPRTPTDYAELPQVYFASAVLPGHEFDFNGRVDLEPVMLSKRVAATAKPVTAQAVSSLSSREVRRNRILSTLSVADAGAEGERSKLMQGREMLVSALDDSGLSDGVRRLGMGGDRLTLKF